MANEIVSELPISAKDAKTTINVTVSMDATMHQKIKLYTILRNSSIQAYVTHLIEYDLKHVEFADRKIPVQEPAKENKKTLLIRMRKETHMKLKLLFTMFNMSFQQYILYLLTEDLKKNGFL